MKSSQIVKRIDAAVPAAIVEAKKFARQLGYKRELGDVYETLFVAVLIKHLRKGKVHTLHEANYSSFWPLGTADIAISRSPSNKRNTFSDTARALIEVKWLDGVDGVASDLRKLCWGQANNRFVLGVPTGKTTQAFLEDAGERAIARAKSNASLGWSQDERRAAHDYFERKDVRIEQHNIAGVVLVELTVPARSPYLRA